MHLMMPALRNRIGTVIRNLPGTGQQAFIHAETAGNFNGAAFAAPAQLQMIQRLQGNPVKGHSAGNHVRCLFRPLLDLGIMGGHHEETSAAQQLLQNRGSQAGTLSRIRAAAQFVQQDQAVPGTMTQDADDIGHMAGEGGQVLADALAVPDIAEYGIHHADDGTLRTGNMQPALGHEGQQADGFQADCFSAGVRTGDGNAGVGEGKLQTEGDAGLTIQEWMPGIDQAYPAPGGQFGRAGIHLQAQFGPGKEHIQVCHDTNGFP